MGDVALSGCRVWRPRGLEGVEVASADSADRAFPARLSDTLGVCLKQGPAHEVLSDGRSLDYPAGAICVRPPGCVWSCTSTGPVGFVSVDVDRAALPRGLAVAPMSFIAADRLPELSRALAVFQRSPSLLRRQEAVAELVLAVEDRLPADELREGGAHRAVAAACQRLRDDLTASPTLDELGLLTGTNKFVLLRRFKRELGITPHAYLVAFRIARARQLLARGTEPSEVAAVVGFADQSHLTRTFKATMGLTPAAYARHVRAVV
jgi:AraC-like DNA-binding protein